MADYLVVGKKRNGKSLVCVGRMRDALQAGLPVATNLNLYLDVMLRSSDRSARLIRLPDHPKASDMACLPLGNPGLYWEGDRIRYAPDWTEDKNGVIVLDECSHWLNSRSYADKERQGLLDWMSLSGKLGWDVYLIAQGVSQVDKQARENLTEYLVTCRRLDRLKIPLIGVKLPRVHIAVVRYGHEIGALVADRWVYRGTDLFACYDTTQRFSASYECGPYSVLPPGYLPQPEPEPTVLDRILAWWNKPAPIVPPRAKHPLVELLQRLPEADRLRHWRRLEALGAI